MTATPNTVSRMRAYAEFLAAVLYYFVIRSFAHRQALSVAPDAWTPWVEQFLLALLLLVGYAAFGSLFDRQKYAIGAQGFPLRQGLGREVGLGLSVGWGVAILCVLPLTVIGGIAVILTVQGPALVWFLADVAFFALAALAEEVAFRGYGFQRFEAAVGPLGACLGFATFYAIIQFLQPGSSNASIAVSIAFSLLLSTVYLRTRALWMSWGLNFAWKASRALIFGLAVSGVNSHSSVVEGDPMGPFWLTGGGFGLDGSWLAFLFLLAAIPVVYRLTRDLDFRFNAPVIIPGGIAVDLDVAARQQHETAMGTADVPESKPLVQILPAASPPVSNPASDKAGQISGDSH